MLEQQYASCNGNIFIEIQHFLLEMYKYHH